MKLSTRDKKVLLMFLGVLFLTVSYLFVYRPQMEQADLIEAENVPLQEELQELLELAKNKTEYVETTEQLKEKILEFAEQFPSDVKAEDAIVLARNMENVMDIRISNVGFSEKVFITSLDGEDGQNALEAPDQTLMEQANETSREQINEIEGVQETEIINIAAETDLASTSLYRNQVTLEFQCTYDSLKRAVKYLAQQSGRMTMDHVNASYDNTTGNLSGSMTVNMFSMTGISREYQEPDAGAVPYGTDNIFGTIEITDILNQIAQQLPDQAAEEGVAEESGQTAESAEGVPAETQDTGAEGALAKTGQ